jgi:hypothetical protein
MKNNLFSQSLYSRMHITSKTVHDINKMGDNFELRYVCTYPGIINRVELVRKALRAVGSRMKFFNRIYAL